MSIRQALKRSFLLRRPLVGVILLALLVLLVVGGWTMHWAEEGGRELVATGEAILGVLHPMARDLYDGAPDAMDPYLDASYSGADLGLNHLSGADERDGIRVRRFTPEGGGLDRPATLAEWRRYREGFRDVEDVQFHIHRLESWGRGEPVVATVRYELQGTPADEARPGIDRAMFRMRFRVDGGDTSILSAELVEGERVTGDRDHFSDVAPAAGVDFENRFYPEFLSRDLAFAMLRYGPAGITAADYDNDGFHDLFIPDGVESRLFRNLGDGSFADVTAAAGLAGLSGVSVGLFADYDNDGHKDFFVSRTFEPNQLFHADGDGTFTDVTERSGMAADCCTTVASWADYDLDGDLDLYVGRYLDPHTQIPTTFYARNGEPNRLYRNDGDSRFTDVTEEAGVAEPGLCLGTVFADYDEDGDPDLYVVNDFGRNTLYRNRGDGSFEDVTLETETLAYGAGMSATFGDYNNDGAMDIYVANIRSEYAWFGEQPSVRRYMLNSMRQGTWWTDWPLYAEIVRQSGFRFKEVFQQMGSGNTLLANRGDGTFEDVTWDANANPPGWFWGSGFYDFDNDGWQDIYSTNGWVYGEQDTEIELEFFEGVTDDQDLYKSGQFYDPAHFRGRSWHGWEHNRHMRNQGDGTFIEIGRASGADLILNSRGIGVADFWNRGVLDIAVAASTDHHALLRNELEGRRNWLAVELAGAGPDRPDGTNLDAVGARVELRAGDVRQIREVVLGDGYGSQSTLRLHFGLDSAAKVDELVVRWPRSGEEQTFRDLPVNRIVRLTEGGDGWQEARYDAPAPSPYGPGETAGDAVRMAEDNPAELDVATGGAG